MEILIWNLYIDWTDQKSLQDIGLPTFVQYDKIREKKVIL
jgi:hypothetical protein